jgi:hypothetical protein
MIVRVNDDGSGVTEIARQRSETVAWTERKESVYGLRFYDGVVLRQSLEPGTYRVEVSTPVNHGAYMLRIGSEADPLGYFATLGQVRAVQKHYDYSIVKMLTSSYVYYPLGIIFLLILFYRTIKFTRKVSHDS